MTRRILGIMAASVLALVGTVALVAFVSGARDRALEGEELVEVYVVSQPIAAGTAAGDIEEMVVVEEVPAKVRPVDAVDSLPALSNRVAAVDLQPGEQLIDSRFIDVSALTDREAGVTVPEEMIEITLTLEPERAIGGLVEPGQRVAVFSSFEPFEITDTVMNYNGELLVLPDSLAPDTEKKFPNTTEIILRKTLVTAVQEKNGGSFNGGEDGEGDRLNTAPEDDLLVTLAVTPSDAERVVFTAEFGYLWLSADRSTNDDDGSVKSRGNVYIDEDGEPVEGDYVILGPSTSENEDGTDGDTAGDTAGGTAGDSGADDETGTDDEQAAGR